MARIAQPRPGESIRLTHGERGPRYRATVDIAPPGAPRRQSSRTFPTLPLARAWVEETRTQIRAGTFAAPARVTLEALAEAWLSSRRDVREGTVNGYRNMLRPVIAEHGARRVQGITRTDVEKWVTAWPKSGGVRGRGLSHRSIVYTLGLLGQVFDYGLAEGILTRNPAEGVAAPRKRAEDTVPVEIWTPQQLAQWLAIADQHPWAGAWRLSACGLRRSEVLGLRWPLVDLSEGVVQVEASRVRVGVGRFDVDGTKSPASRREVPVDALHPGTSEHLRTLKAAQAADRLAAGTVWADQDLVLVDALGRGVHPDAFSDAFARLCRDAQVPVIRLHALRHTLATMLHGADVAPADAAALLGHTVSTHLTFYVKASTHGTARAAARFGEALAAAR